MVASRYVDDAPDDNDARPGLLLNFVYLRLKETKRHGRLECLMHHELPHAEDREMIRHSQSGPIRVLVVDDVLDILQELCIALEMMGFETVPASTYQQVQALLNVAQCDKAAYLDVVVADMRLGHVSGLLLLDDIKALWPAGDGPAVVYLSGIYGEDVKQAALAQGAVAYLTKPSSIKDITECIMNSLKDRDRRR